MINNQARAFQNFGARVMKIGRRGKIGAFDGTRIIFIAEIENEPAPKCNFF
jgi:hypothetical protein